MKSIRNILSVLLMICLLSSMTAAFADNAQEKTPDGENAQPHSAEWDELVDKLLELHNYDRGSVTLGYYNLATGEEHYLNPDTFMGAGSMYKIATSMYYCDKIDKGELQWDSLVRGYQIGRAIEMMIVDSDNTTAQLMWQDVGDWKVYRIATAPYFGVEPENVDPLYFKENYLTPKNIITELKQVYGSIDGKYQKIYEYMSRAEPYKWFKAHEQKYEMGHKYGWIELDGSLYINDSAIIYADDPIAIVMFTKDVSGPVDALADYCTLACEFCAEMAIKDEQEAAEREKALAEQAAAETPEPSKPVVTPAPTPAPIQPASSAPQPVEAEKSSGPAAVIIAAAAALGIAAVTVITAKKKINPAWAALAVILFAGGLLLCASAGRIGHLYSAPSGDPAETVQKFMDSVIGGDYPAAYACVENYSGLGLENTPESYAGELVYKALRESYSYSIDRACETDMLTSHVNVSFTYLDTNAMVPDLAAQAEAVLPALLAEKKAAEIYDSSKNYLPSFTDEVYLRALEAVLSNAPAYYTTKEFVFDLTYSNGGWYIDLSSDIINAISGGTAYQGGGQK